MDVTEVIRFRDENQDAYKLRGVLGFTEGGWTLNKTRPD